MNNILSQISTDYKKIFSRKRSWIFIIIAILWIYFLFRFINEKWIVEFLKNSWNILIFTFVIIPWLYVLFSPVTPLIYFFFKILFFFLFSQNLDNNNNIEKKTSTFSKYIYFWKEFLLSISFWIFLLYFLKGYFLFSKQYYLINHDYFPLYDYLYILYYEPTSLEHVSFIVLSFLISLVIIKNVLVSIRDHISNFYLLYFIISLQIFLNQYSFLIYIFFVYYIYFLYKNYRIIFNNIKKVLFTNNSYNSWYSKIVFDKIIAQFKSEGHSIITWSDFPTLYIKFGEQVKISEKQNYIKLITDNPIDTIQDDLLWHYNTARNIYDLILWLKISDIHKSYSIGVVWEWWIWKSGIVNILRKIWIENRNDMLFYEFNPWNFEKNDLVNNFFSDLSKELEISNIGNSLTKYASIIWNIDSVKSYSYIKDVFSFLFPEKSIHEIKEEINRKLENYNKKIIISIDDLDRCTPDEVMMMLNIIKNLWNFKNIIYLVSYDKENVLNVLKKKEFWEDYLDKIINTEMFIQNANSEQIRKFFIKWVEKILLFVLPDNKEFIQSYLINFTHASNFYDPSRKHEFSADLNWIFEKENIRFIKKLLNQLNIVIQKNFYKMEDFNNINWLWNWEYIKKLIIDLNTLVLINYIKLKDYQYYCLCIKIARDVAQNKTVILNDSEKAIYARYKDFLKYDYLTYISWIYNSNSQVEWWNFRKLWYVQNLSSLLNDIERFS